VSQHVRHVAGVVLAMPISPPTSTVIASAAARAASPRPRSIARIASSRDSAGPAARFALGLSPPRTTSSAVVSAATPASTHTSSAPTPPASTQTAPRPLRNVASICPVTSAGNALTPSAATP
jgi:hypothetical protein